MYHNIRILLILILLFSVVIGQRPLNNQIGISIETSDELRGFYDDVMDNLAYDVTKTINSQFSNDSTSYTWGQHSYYIKSSFHKIDLSRMIIYPTVIGSYGTKSLYYSNANYYSTHYMEKSHAYIGVSPILQLFRKEYSTPFHFNLVPQVGYSVVKISGATRQSVKVRNLRGGLGASLQIKLNKKRQPDKRFEGISVESGVLYDYHLDGQQYWGRIYGESVNTAYDRRIRYPAGLLLFYFNIGYVIKRTWE